MKRLTKPGTRLDPNGAGPMDQITGWGVLVLVVAALVLLGLIWLISALL